MGMFYVVEFEILFFVSMLPSSAYYLLYINHLVLYYSFIRVLIWYYHQYYENDSYFYIKIQKNICI